MHFENEYDFDPSMPAECLQALLKKNTRPHLWIAGGMMAALAAVALATQRLFYLLLIPVIAVFAASILWNSRRLVKKAREQAERNAGAQPLRLRTVIDGGERSIAMYSSAREEPMEYGFSRIEAYMETENMVVVFLKGNLSLSMAKNGFTQGSAESLLHYLRDTLHIKQR